MLLFRPISKVERMNAAEYRQFRLRLAALLVFWAAAVVAIIGYWPVLPLLFKVLGVAVGFVIVPDITTFIQVFSSYDRYSKDGLE